MKTSTYYTGLLRQKFIDKINQDWGSKWAKVHGDNFDFTHLKSQNAFLNDLQNDIEEVIKLKLGLERTSEILISRDSLRRIFNQTNVIWQDKTRQTVAYYIGYDGWNDFIKNFEDYEEPEKDVPVITTSSTKVLSKDKRLVVAGILLFLLIIALAFLYFQPKTQKSETDIKERLEFRTVGKDKLGYPVSYIINYDLSDLVYKDANVVIENQYLQYPDKEIIKLDSKKGVVTNFQLTPGVRIIKLIVDNKIISYKKYLIKTQDCWYGCARILKSYLAGVNHNGTRWYGTVQEANTPQNWLTTYNNWKNYISTSQNKISYPNKYLHFPEEILYSEGKDIISRVAFVKVDSFPVSMNNLLFSFKAKRDKTPHVEDYIVMHVHLYDEDESRIFIGSDIYNSGLNLAFKNVALDKKYEETSVSMESFYVDKLTNITNDNAWHTFSIQMKNDTATLSIDGKVSFYKKITAKFKNLRTIRVTFEGNGSLDDVMLSNPTTKETIFNDNFDN